MNLQEQIHQWMGQNESDGVSLLQQLITVPSTAGYEADAQKIVADKLAEMGLNVDIWEPDGNELVKHAYFYSPRSEFNGSPNVVGIWKGQGGGRSLILNGHVDVVPAGDLKQWDDSPWSGKVVGNRIYGRGSTDMKGGNVSLLLAIQCLKELGVKLKGDIFFQSVVEEESGGAGTLAAILRGYKADAAIIPEPTNMKIFPKQQGSMWFRVIVHGRSAHAGTRYEGVSAIEKSMLIVDMIKNIEKERNDRIDDPLYKELPIPVPINVGVIEGGDWPSSVPDLVKIEGRFGVAPNEKIEDVKKEFELYIAKQCELDEWLKEHPPEIEWFGARWVPGAIDLEHTLMQQLQKHFQHVIGEDAIIQASPWGTDGGLLNKVGDTPAIVFGPGVTKMAHFPNEYIEADKMLQAAEIIALTMADWCEMVD